MLAIAYDRGAASAAEIANAWRGHPIAFLVPDTPYATDLTPVLAELGTVIPLTGDACVDVARVRRLGPDGIVTFSEAMLRTTTLLTDALGLPGHSPGTVGVLTDKHLQRERLAQAGVDAMRHYAVSDPADWAPALETVGLPAVVKPVHGLGSRDTHLIEDRAAARRLGELPASEGWVLEEYLRGRPSLPYGDFVSVESVSTPAGVTHLMVTGKYPQLPPFRELGHFWPADLPAADRAAVLDLVGRALHALDVQVGITHTEVKLTPGGPRIIEVNGRLGGHQHDLGLRSSGIDLIRVGGLIALGEPVAVDPVLSSRVTFQYNAQGPTEPCRLTALTGAGAVRKVSGVTGYRPHLRVGTRLAGGVGTYELDMLYGDAADHRGMFAVLDQALVHLTYEFRFDDGRVVSMTAPRPWARTGVTAAS